MSRTKPIAANYYINNGAKGKRHLGDCLHINKARRIHAKKIVTISDASIPVCPLCQDRILDEARSYPGIRVVTIVDSPEVPVTDQGEIPFDPGYFSGRVI